MPEIRPLLRPDREQLTDLVNAHVAAWLRMGHSRNLLSYVADDETEVDLRAWHVANGFEELNRTRRGWTRVS